MSSYKSYVDGRVNKAIRAEFAKFKGAIEKGEIGQSWLEAHLMRVAKREQERARRAFLTRERRQGNTNLRRNNLNAIQTKLERQAFSLKYGL